MKVKSKEVDILLAILTIVFGGFVRIFPGLASNFPLGDGGMFYSMIKDLQAANYALPTFISYNHQQIPFAYPPFALYFTGIINSLTKIPLLKLIQWQPVVISCLTLVVGFFFFKRFTGSSTKAWLATFIFALIPNTFWWQIVGGGITRSFGAIFAFLFTYFAFRIFHDKDRSLYGFIGAILSGALVVLSHPEWALQAAFTGFLFSLFWARDWNAVRKAVVIPIAVLALTSFWWGSVLQRFGLQLFFSASSATSSRLLFFVSLFKLQFTGEYTIFFAVFIFIGAFVAMAKREYFLLVWGIGCLVVDPRGGVPFAMLPFSVLAMYSITDLITPYFLKIANCEDDPWWNFLALWLGKLFFGVFAILCLSHAYEVSNIISYRHLSDGEQQAMLWVKNNSTLDDIFLVLGGETNPTHSSLTEWFPALTDRQSNTTVQGQEWLGNYHAAIDSFLEYQKCLLEDLSCIQVVDEKNGNKENCIFISYKYLDQIPENNSLFISLQKSTLYDEVFSSQKIKIFCLNK